MGGDPLGGSGTAAGAVDDVHNYQFGWSFTTMAFGVASTIGFAL